MAAGIPAEKISTAAQGAAAIKQTWTGQSEFCLTWPKLSVIMQGRKQSPGRALRAFAGEGFSEPQEILLPYGEDSVTECY